MMREHYHHVLCVRADNMGDVIMTSPAMRALKETFNCRITLLTSRAGAAIVPFLECVDEVIVADLPWVKTSGEADAGLLSLVRQIRNRNFDAGIIFTVYSQSALPAAMLLYMAGVPVRVGYARENPYDLLNRWIPEIEPYERILHQVRRDLELVESIGAQTVNEQLKLCIGAAHQDSCQEKLSKLLANPHAGYLILHPGVSEVKREYPAELWIATGKMLARKYGLPLLITGSFSESNLAERIAEGIGPGAFSVAGIFTLGEFIGLIRNARCVVSVNTGTIHIAAAMQTPLVVLYAQTNPQHTPWQSPHEVLPFSVPAHLKSRNAIIRYVDKELYAREIPYPGPLDILAAVEKLIGIGQALTCY